MNRRRDKWYYICMMQYYVTIKMHTIAAYYNIDESQT